MFVTRRDPDALELIRHDAAHVLAEAVQELYPGTQVTIGPAIENGFYYDFARNEPFTPEDFPADRGEDARDRRARRAVRAPGDGPRRGDPLLRGQGREVQGRRSIQDLPRDETITLYRQGDWVDLCRGPHMRSTADVGTAFKLMKVAGAYWRGDHRNAMLSRIYGTAWRDQKELDAYLHQLEEAERATIAASARRWTCSTSRKRRWAACSGTRRAGSSTAPPRTTCAAGWTRPAIRR